MHLNCRKGPEQPPTRKQGLDLFRKTSDDNSKIHSNKHEFEAPRVTDTMTEERDLESGRSTPKDEDHHGYEI